MCVIHLADTGHRYPRLWLQCVSGMVTLPTTVSVLPLCKGPATCVPPVRYTARAATLSMPIRRLSNCFGSSKFFGWSNFSASSRFLVFVASSRSHSSSFLCSSSRLLSASPDPTGSAGVGLSRSAWETQARRPQLGCSVHSPVIALLLNLCKRACLCFVCAGCAPPPTINYPGSSPRQTTANAASARRLSPSSR